MPGFTNHKVKVNKTSDGRLAVVAPIHLRDQHFDIRSIEDIKDVIELAVENGATLVYNANDDVYEIKLLSFNDLDGAVDGGSF